MDACARHFGLQGSFFATPTAIMAALGAPGERHEVVLLPGLSFTTALAELAMRHLAAGSARLLGAAAVMLTMAVGVGLGDRAGTLCWGEVGKQEPQVLDAAWQWPALLAAGLAFAVLLRAVRSQLLWVMGAVAIGFIGARLGALLFERELGA